MIKNPCKRCLTLPMCKAQSKQQDSIVPLLHKCSLIKENVYRSNEYMMNQDDNSTIIHNRLENMRVFFSVSSIHPVRIEGFKIT